MKDNNYSVYKHTSPSGKVYIGISKNIKKRWSCNGYNYKGQTFYNAVLKYGWDNIKHEILFEGLTEEDAKLKEIELIAEYDSMNKGYNSHPGGGTTPIITKKIICLNNRKVFNSIIEASSYSGCHYTNISNCCAGRQKMTINDKREIFLWMYHEKYLTLTDEDIEEFITMKMENRNRYVCLNTGEIFFTATDAGKKYNTSGQCIGKVCLNKQKSAGKDQFGNKLVWAYYKDYIKMSKKDIEEKIKLAHEMNNEFRKNEEYLNKIREVGKRNKGRKPNVEQLQKQRELMLEKWKDEQYLEKMRKVSLKNSGDNHTKARKVICLNDNLIFGCIKNASLHYNVSANSISECCRGIQNKAGELIFMYYEEYLTSTKDKIEYKFKRAYRDRCGNFNNRNREVICLNTKERFLSITEAKKWAVNASKICDCCMGNRKTAGKHPVTGEPLKWMYYEDYLKREKGGNNDNIR